MNEQLITQNIDCSAVTGVTLRFKHHFHYWAEGLEEVGDVDININGAGWQNTARYAGSDFNGLVEIPLSSFGADGASNVQVRWHYYNANFEWYWGIDDVQITGNLPGPVLPVDDLNHDCMVDYNDLYDLCFAWLSTAGQSNWNAGCDISIPADGSIDFLDFAVFAQNWLQ
jgi:hypothetical protein